MRPGLAREQSIMKIDGAGQQPDGLPPVEPGREREPARADPTSRRAVDHVDLSVDAKLLRTAIEVAQRAPDVREAVVARMRQKLDSGELGRDPAQLAERMIQRLLEQSNESLARQQPVRSRA